MVGTQNGVPYEQVIHRGYQRFVCEKIIDSPSDIALSRPGLEVPPGVFDLVRIEMAVEVDIVILDKSVDLSPFFRQKTDAMRIFLGPGDVDFGVDYVDIPAKKDFWIDFLELFEEFEESVEIFQLVFKSVRFTPAVWKITVDEDEIFKNKGDLTAFLVQFVGSQAVDDFLRFDFGIDRDAAVSFARLSRIEIGKIAIRLLNVDGQLFQMGLGLLEAENVRCGIEKVIEKPLLFPGPNAVDVPGYDFKRFFLHIRYYSMACGRGSP